MNTNSKILPTQDSNLSCYSPSILTFSAPTFCLSSFMILVGGRIPFPKNTYIFYVMVTKGVTEESTLPPPPPTNCPWKIAPIKIALGWLGQSWSQAIHQGQFCEEQIQFQPKGSHISRLNFLPLKTELLHGGMHNHLKGLIGFNLLFLFYSQWKKIA